MQTINFEIQRKFEVTQYPFYVHAHGSYYMFPCYDYSIEVDNNGIKKSTLNLKEILNCYQSIPATQDQQEARRLFDKALSDAAQTLNQYLPKSYFLFGMKAVELYQQFEGADIEAKVDEIASNADYNLCEFSFFDNPSRLLDIANGCEDYAEITEAEYKLFVDNKVSEQWGKEDREREMTEEDNDLKASKP